MKPLQAAHGYFKAFALQRHIMAYQNKRNLGIIQSLLRKTDLQLPSEKSHISLNHL
jgi:hypothetical protein